MTVYSITLLVDRNVEIALKQPVQDPGSFGKPKISSPQSLRFPPYSRTQRISASNVHQLEPSLPMMLDVHISSAKCRCPGTLPSLTVASFAVSDQPDGDLSMSDWKIINFIKLATELAVTAKANKRTYHQHQVPELNTSVVSRNLLEYCANISPAD